LWIAYAPLTAGLLLFLGVVRAGEWVQIGLCRARRLGGNTSLDERPTAEGMDSACSAAL
jgi:hypothetical protein